MRPNHGSTSNDFEVEISPLEFFQDLGVMVVEGRLPELSNNGRSQGEHSWPISYKSMKDCCYRQPRKQLCCLVSSTRSKILESFGESNCLYIETYGTVGTNATPTQTCRVFLDKGGTSCNLILLERWKIQISRKSGSNDLVNPNMMFQAVRSYLHFSQLCAWWNKSNGTFPNCVYYRISFACSISTEFLDEPVYHRFPLTEISRTEAIEVHVSSLPRMDIPEAMFLIKQNKNVFNFTENETLKDYLTLENVVPSTSDTDSGDLEAVPSFYSPNSKQILNAFATFSSSSLAEPCFSGHTGSCKRKKDNIDLYCASHSRSSNCQKTNYSGEKFQKYDCNDNNGMIVNRNEHLVEFQTEQSSTNYEPVLSLSDLINIESQTSNHVKLRKDQDGLSSMLEGFVLNGKNEAECTDEGEEDYDDDDYELEQYNCNNEHSNDDFGDDKKSKLQPCQKRIRSKSVSPHFAAKQKNANEPSKPIAARRLAMVAGTIPVFNPKTGLPLSSSPAPVKKPRKASESSLGGSLSKSGSFDELTSCVLGLSSSAPPPTSLLGNFEESVLNGRMPVNGTLEGFWAELGASGSFCPKHISVPIKIQYFSLSDDNAPSPYLGRICLLDKKKRKRYRVPRKGTIQLTIFNPNSTVVKVFIVLYDLQDMPNHTRTFLRQRIVSIRKDPKTMSDVQTLHYLIHLSFVSSKKSNIYLHTDIRVIFRQRAPEDSLHTITNGPTNPKYTSIAKRNHTREEVDSN